MNATAHYLTAPPRRRVTPRLSRRRPLVCICRHPEPTPVRICDTVVVAGAVECGHCGRKVIEGNRV